MKNTPDMDISIVVPLYNEEESLPELTAWIGRVMQQHNFSYEVLLVDDGSSDHSWDVIEQLSKTDSAVRGIKFRRNHGKSAALFSGFEAARGKVVITMDADLQDSPDEIPDLFRMITEEHFDMVSGWKRKRYDPLIKTIPSKLFNGTARLASGIRLNDFNCGLKAYRNEVIKSIEVYGEMHRYIPILAKNAGFKRIGEKVVRHQARKYGQTKFGLDRFINGYLDLLSVVFTSKFGKKPMHFFGLMGTFMMILGFGSATYVGVSKLVMLARGIRAPLVTDNPYFFLALTCMIIGVQLFLAGFIAELVSRNSTERNKYFIEKRTYVDDGPKTGDG
jgi:glycosyltransferase involved in cell wall biosynthesis